MEERKRTILAVLIACVVLVAVLYSFGLNLFIQTPELEAPGLNASSTPGQATGDPAAGGIPVEITPQTVQLAISSLSRYESYSRSVSATYLEDGEAVGSIAAQVWVEGGWVRTETTLPSGLVECSLVGDGQLWLWYDGQDQVYRAPAGDQSADLAQRLPTYEDVLALDPAGITQAGYVERDGQDCIYVEFEHEQLGYLYRYWISVNSGLLIAAQTESEGQVVYEMSSRQLTSPLSGPGDWFVLPDGTSPRE
ncbi:MAG TPA: hypothetical protein IAC84_06585 [Firmicutes bacterium]|nr:hypothetical protein [Bacillota bacterium]